MRTFRDFDAQFYETPTERNERLRENRLRRNIQALQQLIADLSPNLADESNDYSPEGLAAIRRRVANALPPALCPDWLEPYRDAPVVPSGAPRP